MTDAATARRSFKAPPKLAAQPSVAVLLGVRNAALTVDSVIEIMRRQDYAGAWHMWIAVAPSEDGTGELVRRLVAGDACFTVLDNPRGDLASGFNLGLRSSVSDVVSILSGHCLPDEHYLSACVRGLQETRAGLVGGAARPYGEGYLHEAIAIAHRLPVGLGGGAFRDESREGWVDTVYVGAYPRAVLEEIGEWNETLVRNQDIELNARVRAAGYGVYLSRDVVVRYRPRANLAGLARQNYGNGYWNVRTLQDAGSVLSARHAVPGVFVALVGLGLGGTVLAALLGWTGMVSVAGGLTAAALGLYLLVIAAASISAGFRYGLRYAAVLPAVLATLHVSYGLGEVAALLTTGLRGRNHR